MKVVRAHNSYDAIILSFADGDTVRILKQCNECRVWIECYVRLYQLESYERDGPDKAKAMEISERLTKQYKNTSCVLIAKKTHPDKYGRIIGELFIGNNNLSTILVNNKDAWYKFYKQL